MSDIIDMANDRAEADLAALLAAQCQRSNSKRPSATHCQDELCGVEITEQRRAAVPGCQLCADCQERRELIEMRRRRF